MKTTSLTVPIVIAALTVVTIWGMGLLAVKASAIATEASLQTLRLHLRVARIHDQLLKHSQQGLDVELQKLGAEGHLEPSDPTDTQPVPSAKSAPRPWPSL